MNYSHAVKKATEIKQNQVVQRVSSDLMIDNTANVKPYVSKIYKEYQTYPKPPLFKENIKLNEHYLKKQEQEKEQYMKEDYEENSKESNERHINVQTENNPTENNPSISATSPHGYLPILTVQPISNMKGYYKLFDDQLEQVYNDRILKLKSDIEYYDSHIANNKKILSEQINTLNKHHQRLIQNDATIRYNIDFIASQQTQINSQHNLLLQQNTQIRSWEEKINQLQTIAQQFNSHIEYQQQLYMQQQAQQQAQQNYQMIYPSLPQQQPQFISQDLINNMSQILASMLTNPLPN